MDPFSLSCNIVGVLTAAGQLLAAGYSYGNAVKDFPDDLRALVGELSSLSGILHTLKVVIEPPEGNNFVVAATSPDPSGLANAISIPLSDCEGMLVDMLENLKKYQESGSRVQKMVKRLTWPLKGNETQSWTEKIGRYKSTFQLALSADDLALTRIICDHLGEIKNLQVKESERKDKAEKKERFSKVLRWISPADAEINHAAARKLQQSGTGRWFTGGKTFRDWLESKDSFLWLYGIAGAGKTILSSIIIDRIISELSNKGTDIAVTYFYFDFKEAAKQTSLGFLGSIIAQLTQKKPQRLQALEALYDASNGGRQQPDAWSLEQFLHKIIGGFSRVIIVADALDECAEQSNLFQVVERLRGLRNLSLLITSRDELNIKLQFTNLPSLFIKKDDNSADIENFVGGEIQRQPKLARLKPTTKLDITTALIKGSNGMFRWAKCCLDHIARLRSDKAIKAALKSLPPTLEETYERILRAIPEEDITMARRVFRWLLFSRRPMALTEVAEAIVVEVGDESMDSEKKLNEPQDILDICRGLIEIDDTQFTLGLSHFTVKEYLISANIIESSAAGYHVKHTVAHAELAKICLTYTMFSDFDDGPCDDYEAQLGEYPLLTYAVQYWPEHVSEYGNQDDETLSQLILSFFHLGQDSEKFQLWRQLYEICRGTSSLMTGTKINSLRDDISSTKSKSDSVPATPLYYAAEMGQLQAVSELLELGTHVDVKGGTNYTPTKAAIIGGHEATLRLLLEKGADPNEIAEEAGHDICCRDSYPLSIAAGSGQAGCVQALLDFAADVGRIGYGTIKDPLLAASWSGHGNVVEVLIEADYFISKGAVVQGANCSDEAAQFVTAYLYSALQGLEKPIRTLLQRGGDALLTQSVSPKGEAGDFFLVGLGHAIENGHLKIIKIILQRDDAKAFCLRDNELRAILQQAAYSGREKVLDLLLSLRKTPGREALGSSLHLAAADGNVGAIERLIRAGADPNGKDDDGWSPMVCASECHNPFAMEKLSKFGAVLDASDIVGPTSWGDKPLPLEISTDGLEIKMGDQSQITIIRARHPIPPLVPTYSFEVEVVELSWMAIGFADMFYEQTIIGSEIFNRAPGMHARSWGYSYEGHITLDDEMDSQKITGYRNGAVVGCHFDKIKAVAFFTVNGELVGKPIADMKGKLVPLISLGINGHIRTNFGDKPFAYETPELSAEVMSKLWRPNPMIHIGPRKCKPNV